MNKLIDDIKYIVEAGCPSIFNCDDMTRQHLVSQFLKESPELAEEVFFQAIKVDGEIGPMVSVYDPYNQPVIDQFWTNFGFHIGQTFIELLESLIDEDFTNINSALVEEKAAIEFGKQTGWVQ